MGVGLFFEVILMGFVDRIRFFLKKVFCGLGGLGFIFKGRFFGYIDGFF